MKVRQTRQLQNRLDDLVRQFDHQYEGKHRLEITPDGQAKVYLGQLGAPPYFSTPFENTTPIRLRDFSGGLAREIEDTIKSLRKLGADIDEP